MDNINLGHVTELRRERNLQIGGSASLYKSRETCGLGSPPQCCIDSNRELQGNMQWKEAGYDLGGSPQAGTTAPICSSHRLRNGLAGLGFPITKVWVQCIPLFSFQLFPQSLQSSVC